MSLKHFNWASLGGAICMQTDILTADNTQFFFLRTYEMKCGPVIQAMAYLERVLGFHPTDLSGT